MSNLEERQALIGEMAEHLKKNIYHSEERKITTPRKEYQAESQKVVSLEEAIRRSGLKDGMTVLAPPPLPWWRQGAQHGDGQDRRDGHQGPPRGCFQPERRPQAPHRAHQEWRRDPHLHLWYAWRAGQGHQPRHPQGAGGVPFPWWPWLCHRQWRHPYRRGLPRRFFLRPDGQLLRFLPFRECQEHLRLPGLCRFPTPAMPTTW